MENQGEPPGTGEKAALAATEVVGRGEEVLSRAKALSRRLADRLWTLCGVDRRAWDRAKPGTEGAG